MNKPKYAIGRYPESIVLNQMEYLLNDDGKILEFDTEDLALEHAHKALEITGSVGDIEENFGVYITTS